MRPCFCITPKGRWCGIIDVNVHAPSEDKDDDIKDSFMNTQSDQGRIARMEGRSESSIEPPGELVTQLYMYLFYVSLSEAVEPYYSYSNT